MELDEFKILYNTSAGKPEDTDQNIMEMISRQSQGPLAMLVKKIKYTLYLFPVSIIFFAGLFIPALGGRTVMQNPISDLLFIILFAEYVVAVLNYYTIKKLQSATGNIRQNLLVKVQLLKRRYKWYFIINAGLFLFIPVLLELNVHYRFDSRFQGLSAISIYFRIPCYAVILILLLIIKGKAQNQNYGQYLDHLTGLSEQIQ